MSCCNKRCDKKKCKKDKKCDCKTKCDQKKHCDCKPKCDCEPESKDCCDALPSAFVELGGLLSLDDGVQTVLTVNVSSSVPRELIVIATASPNVDVDTEQSPVELQFRVQVVGTSDPATGALNGAFMTFDMNADFPTQGEAGSVVRRYTLPAGTFTVNLLAIGTGIGASSVNLDPAFGGATLLVQQRPV